jgi:hypothetical protein
MSDETIKKFDDWQKDLKLSGADKKLVKKYKKQDPLQAVLLTKEIVRLKRDARIELESGILGSIKKLFTSQLAEAIGTMTLVERTETGEDTTWKKVIDPDKILKILQEKELGIDYILIKNGGDWRAADSLLDRLFGRVKYAKDEDSNDENPKNIFNQFNTFIQDKPIDVLSERTIKKIEAKKLKETND